jgi:hypothetical protein
VQNVNLRPAANGQFYGSLDTTTKTSGAGSLRFRLAAGNAFANIAGQWLPSLNDKAMGGRMFGQNSEFYVQYRVRLSPEMFSNLAYWDSWWKQSIFHMDFSSCNGIEITTNHRGYTGPTAMLPNVYTNCGQTSPITDPSTGLFKTDQAPPYNYQQGDYTCAYGQSTTDCWHYTANEWTTFYYHVKVGTWDTQTSQLEVWVAKPSIENGAYKKIISVPNMLLTCNQVNCTGVNNEGWNNITLTPYMTALSKSAPVDAYVWYDELIVSTQPIAVPGSTSLPTTQPPLAPTNLVVK